MSTRRRALTVGCPRCEAAPWFPCEGPRGPRLAVHRDRIRAAKKPVLRPPRLTSGGFYGTEEWRRVRYKALKLHGGACQCCGAKPSQGKPLHVDHIKPRSRFPALELDLSNLQVLCVDCNLGKGAHDITDWRATA